KVLGPKVGKDMKVVGQAIQELDQQAIAQLERDGTLLLEIGGQPKDDGLPEGNGHRIGLEDVEILAEDVAGWQVATLGRLTVALDIQVTPALKAEGISRELINRIQNLRKDNRLEVTDRIRVRISDVPEITSDCQARAESI